MSPSSARSCWLAGLSDEPCDGRLVRVHLIPQQVIKREVRRSAALDPRTWVWACGGAVGVSGHHGMLDYARTLRVPRHRLPAALEDFAEETGLGWWLDREYGQTSPAGTVPLDPIGHMQARQARR
jgi:hypothetical protein